MIAKIGVDTAENGPSKVWDRNLTRFYEKSSSVVTKKTGHKIGFGMAAEAVGGMPSDAAATSCSVFGAVAGGVAEAGNQRDRAFLCS